MINRIIGILVVLALGILIYPFALSSRDNLSAQADRIQLPPFPSPQTQNATLKALSQGSENAALKAEIRDKKHVKASYKNVAWVIQVGSYRDKVKALTLANQLRAKGYNAFIHQSHAAFGEETQVYVGPEAKKDSAATLAFKLAKEARLSGEVKTYKMLSV